MREFYGMAGYAPGNRYRDATLPAMLDDVAVRFADREALVFLEQRLTYRALRRAVERGARALLALGVGPGEAVALWLPTRPEWLVLQHAIAWIGARAVAIDARLGADALASILRRSGATTLVLQDHAGPVDYFERLASVVPDLTAHDPGELRCPALPRLRRVVCLADDVYSGTSRYADLVDAGDDPDLAGELEARRGLLAPDRAFAIVCAAEAGAVPGGAIVSHRNVLPHAWASGQRLGLSPADRVLHTLLCSDAWGGLVVPLMTLAHGATLVLEDGFDPGVTLHLLEAERITVWHAVDAMLVAVLEHPDRDRHDRRWLRTGGVALDGNGRDRLFDRVVTRLGMTGAVQPYGTPGVVAMALCPRPDDPLELRRHVGLRPAEGLEARVADPATGAERPAGMPGELRLRGPQLPVGDLGDLGETRAALDADGWLHTGDLAVRDEAGHVRVLGRASA